jgi:hypothetical protein
MFIKNTRIPSVQGTQNLIGTPPLPAPQNNIFIFGNRRNATTSETSGLPILDPDSGFPLYEYYNTYPLPSQLLNDPLGMLSYFKDAGFTVTTGYSATVQLNNATAVDILTLAADNQVIVYYTNASTLVEPLVGTGITGTFNDTTAVVTGTFISAEIGSFLGLYDSKIILEAAGFASVAAADNISISFTNSTVLVPDPTGTEPFIMNLFSAIDASLIPENVNSTIATPQVYFSFLPDAARSGLFGPTATPLTLTAPTAQTATTVSFAIPSLNVAYIPMSALGATTITQAVTLAVGTVVSSVVNGGQLIVTLSNVTGTFNTTNVCTLHLDATQTVFSFQKKLFATKVISLQQLALPYAINSSTDITTTYKAAFDYVAELNQPATSQSGQAICLIPFANLTIAQNSAALSLPTNVNNYQFEPIYYPYQPIIGELPLSAGQMAAAFAMVVGSNVNPLNPQGGVIINGLPTPTNPNKYIDVTINGIAVQVMKLGWNTIAVNNNQQAYIVNPITGMTTLPNLTTPDNEFFPIYVWQTLDYLRKGVTLICQQMGLGQIRQTPRILSILKGNIVIFMQGMQTSGMLLNVLQNESLITIIQDPNNPLGIDITIPTQIVPGLEDIFYTINVFSSTVNLITNT